MNECFPFQSEIRLEKESIFLKYFIAESKKKIILEVNPWNSITLRKQHIVSLCTKLFGSVNGKLEVRLYLDWPFISFFFLLFGFHETVHHCYQRVCFNRLHMKNVGTFNWLPCRVHVSSSAMNMYIPFICEL